jgi:hypothetical protein
MKNIEQYKRRFYKLLESTMGDVKPLLVESELDEVDLVGTYLEPKTKPIELGTQQKSQVLTKKGKIFKDNPYIQSEPFLTFEDLGGNEFKVIFPDKFIEKYFSEPISNQVDSKDFGPYGLEHPDVPVVMKIAANYTAKDYLDNVRIRHEGFPTNRIHFASGVPSEFRGTGLGYLVYEEFIKFLGWGSSSSTASQFAQQVWAKIAKDPDFYSIIFNISERPKVLAIYKKSPFSPKQIVMDFIRGEQKMYSEVIINKDTVKIDDDLLKDYPDLVNIFNKEGRDSLEIEEKLNNMKSFLEKLSNFDEHSDTFDYKLQSSMLDDSRTINKLVYSSFEPNENYYKFEGYVKQIYDLLIKKFYTPNEAKIGAFRGPSSWGRKNKNNVLLSRKDNEYGFNYEWNDGSKFARSFEMALTLFTEFVDKFLAKKYYLQ